MAKGKKTGGRVAGTPNKSSRDVHEFVDAVFARVDPIALAERLLKSEDKTSATILVKLLEYRFGKPVQPISGEGGGPVLMQMVTNVAEIEI